MAEQQSVYQSAIGDFVRQAVDQTKKSLAAFEQHRKEFIEAGAAFGGLPEVKPFQRAYEEAALLQAFRSNAKFRDELRPILAKYFPASPAGADGGATPPAPAAKP
jgi:hypothetical protein